MGLIDTSNKIDKYLNEHVDEKRLKKVGRVIIYVLIAFVVAAGCYRWLPKNRVTRVTFGYTGSGENDTVFDKKIEFNHNKMIRIYYIKEQNRTKFPFEWTDESYWIDE